MLITLWKSAEQKSVADNIRAFLFIKKGKGGLGGKPYFQFTNSKTALNFEVVFIHIAWIKDFSKHSLLY